MSHVGVVRGDTPPLHGRPRHDPLVAFTDTGDGLGLQWRPGDAHSAAGALARLRGLARRRRQAEVRHVTARLEMGFFSRAMVDTPTASASTSCPRCRTAPARVGADAVAPTTALRASWRRAQPTRLRARVLRVPVVHTTLARWRYVQRRLDEPRSARCTSSMPCHPCARDSPWAPEGVPIPITAS